MTFRSASRRLLTLMVVGSAAATVSASAVQPARADIGPGPVVGRPSPSQGGGTLDCSRTDLDPDAYKAYCSSPPPVIDVDTVATAPERRTVWIPAGGTPPAGYVPAPGYPRNSGFWQAPPPTEEPPYEADLCVVDPGDAQCTADRAARAADRAALESAKNKNGIDPADFTPAEPADNGPDPANVAADNGPDPANVAADNVNGVDPADFAGDNGADNGADNGVDPGLAQFARDNGIDPGVLADFFDDTGGF